MNHNFDFMGIGEVERRRWWFACYL